MRNGVPDYRRYRVEGGTYFFTVNLLERFPNDLLVQHIDLLRNVVRKVRAPDRVHFIHQTTVNISTNDEIFMNIFKYNRLAGTNRTTVHGRIGHE